MALDRLVQPAREILDREVGWLQPNVPITRAAWITGVEQAGLNGNVVAIDGEVEALAKAYESGNPTALRRAALRLANRISEIQFDMRALSVFQPSREADIIGTEKKIRDLARGAIDLAALDPVDIESLAQELILAQAGLTSVSIEFADDISRAVFGIERDLLSNPDGTLSPSRVMGHFYGRAGELQRIVSSIFHAFADSSPGIHDGVMPVWALVSCSQPLTVMRSALFVREEIERAFAEDPQSASSILRTYKFRVDRSKANHAGIIRTQQAQRNVTTEAEDAELSLDLYRRVVEGQFRPWAWTLLQLRGRQGSRLPELSTLRDQLIADGNRVMRLAADAILPTVRNAAAHEDFEWDEALRQIRVGENVTTLQEIEKATTQAYEFMVGCELAINACRAANRQLVEAMDSEDPVEGSRAINLGVAVNMFGSNGLQVRSHRFDRGVFRVELEEWPTDRINPGLQALVSGAAALRQAQRFQIIITGHELPVVDLSRESLDANFPVWRQAIAHFYAMPTSTFLPVNIAVRLGVEGREQAALSATRLALGDALDALALLQSDNKKHLKKAWSHIKVRLALIEHAFRVGREIGEFDNISEVEESHTRLGRIYREISKSPRDISMTFMGDLVRGLEREWEELGPVPVLPSVDETLV